MIECFLYFLINSGFNMPIFERKNETIGSSNTNPAASIVEIIKLKYSSMAIMLSMAEEPNVEKKDRAVGSRTKYANTTPERKQNVEKKTIEEMYFRSFGFNAGSMNFQN